MNRLTLDNVDKFSTKYEQKVKKLGKKIRVIAMVLGVLTIGAVLFMAFYNISRWYDENKVIFQYPVLIKFQTPIKIEKRKNDAVMPLKSAKEVVKLHTQPEIFEEAYNKVWLMESGRGTNKGGLNGYCIAQGKINEIGYAPHDKYCFENEEEQKSTFMTWLTNRINKVKMPYCDNVDQCLLIYSNGAYGLE